MEPSTIHSQSSEFEERNTFLYFVLGLVSVSHRFKQHLAKSVPDHVPQETQADESPPDPDASGLLI
jgi:hypothetical protein